jgi:cell division protein FtsW (lipid II flippase)
MSDMRVRTRAAGADRPSTHLPLLVALAVLAGLGHVAVIAAGLLRGYDASSVIAVRNVLFFVPIIAAFLWIVRRYGYRGTCVPFTAATLMFTIGLVVQYRLFNDPEYGARGAERRAAREAKAQTVRHLNVRTGYTGELGERKKLAMFDGSPIPETLPGSPIRGQEYSLGDALASPNTYIPVLAVLAFAVSFAFFRSSNFLLWLQRYTITIALTTLVPFAVVVLAFSAEGKFLGQTTPWEPVKIVFLLTFAAMLTDAYRHLARTRWGLPQARFALPLVVVAALPLVPFFALSDFGQMLVFFGVYLALYIAAVRSRLQLVYALGLGALLASLFYVTVGLPARVFLRFHLWLDTRHAPAQDAAWWAPVLHRTQAQYGSAVSNDDAWYDYASQLVQGLFGISDGGLFGNGLGLGYPEIVPVSDSDFIYAAIAEELGILGALVVVAGVVALVLCGTRIAIESRDMFTKLIAAGFTAFLGLQALVNIGGVIRVMPMTGITLPFVSHGGWSLITSFAMLGILMAISHRNAMVSDEQGNAYVDVVGVS